ncbi:hypothetical protein COU60_04125 [Candidatus Pacearchaeota archaeon CG10_big_fil_rev_8_21_14_0_10_34_76]|nr:MAG: hypothetical protein COU60_04125 [Candidatus Pacearchaeota archaeon CG10_big_fil_rev_8_21_14_0_10_34_76]
MKSKTNLETMQNFSLKNIPDLDVCVLGALELFSDTNIPKIEIPYKKPLVVGSGNAEATGRIMFEDRDAVFASESNFEEKLKKISSIDGVVLISASGGKHAPIIARCSKKYKKHVTLITANINSQAEKYLDDKHKYDLFIFPNQREPYTYNTSTYMGMILGKTRENPNEIHDFIISKIDKIKLPNFSRYDKYYLIVPPQFSGIVRMLNIKFIELFGRRVARDVETSEYVKHATTIVPSNELFISFGEENKTWGEKKNRLHIPLPKNSDYGTMMAVSYYIIGKIQKSHTPYFKKNILSYTNNVSKIFKQEIKPIVE